jgi:hypothetical protein
LSWQIQSTAVKVMPENPVHRGRQKIDVESHVVVDGVWLKIITHLH